MDADVLFGINIEFNLSWKWKKSLGVNNSCDKIIKASDFIFVLQPHFPHLSGFCTKSGVTSKLCETEKKLLVLLQMKEEMTREIYFSFNLILHLSIASCDRYTLEINNFQVNVYLCRSKRLTNDLPTNV